MEYCNINNIVCWYSMIFTFFSHNFITLHFVLTMNYDSSGFDWYHCCCLWKLKVHHNSSDLSQWYYHHQLRQRSMLSAAVDMTEAAAGYCMYWAASRSFLYAITLSSVSVRQWLLKLVSLVCQEGITIINSAVVRPAW